MKGPHGIRQIPEGIALVEVLAGAAVARQVGDDEGEVLGERRDIARSVGDATGARAAAVEENEGRTRARGGDEEFARSDPDHNCPLSRTTRARPNELALFGTAR
ncbi:hypothetical protein GCM10009811_23380 [Nostocoides veronense]|uniref:Uncharacterized protein n=1 Tax=Nostocoides veronense TaxID=330836 RepID=A0ABP4XYX3_9MICO